MEPETSKLLLNEKEYRLLFEYAAIGMALVSHKGHYIRVNKEWCKITGYTQ
jgi:PAS domain S-box-containing protein